jgi:hypothetical protein
MEVIMKFFVAEKVKVKLIFCSDAQLSHVADVRQAVRFAVSEVKDGDLLPGEKINVRCHFKCTGSCEVCSL